MTEGVSDAPHQWHYLCGLAVQICGSQERFRKECQVLRRLFVRYGGREVEKMLEGAISLKWTSLRSLGSADGVGRRWALAAWGNQRKVAAQMPEGLKQIMRGMGQ